MDVGKYLEMTAYMPAGRKTLVWEVKNRIRNILLGEIRWFGRWRQYAFFPAKDTVFNVDCMADIAAFIKDRMEERKKHG
jgi:hypothetical protein